MWRLDGSGLGGARSKRDRRGCVADWRVVLLVWIALGAVVYVFVIVFMLALCRAAAMGDEAEHAEVEETAAQTRAQADTDHERSN